MSETNRPTTTQLQLAAYVRQLDPTADSDLRATLIETARREQASTTRRQIAALNGEPEIDEKKDSEREARKLRIENRRLKRQLRELGE